MKSIIVLFACLFVANAITDYQYQTSFLDFMITHNKAYAADEFQYRYSVFRSNLDFIEKHNSMGLSFTVGVNQFADLTVQEFVSAMNGVVVSHEAQGELHVVDPSADPDTVDWRTQGYVTPIKNQGQCGSCWSFSATGSTEGAFFKSTGKLVSLSEQNLVDCSKSYGNNGCNGGLMDDAFKYIIANKGIDTEASYPYTAKDGVCHFTAADVGATISSFRDVAKNDESALMDAVATVGPVSVAIDAAHSSFQLYKTGVYYEAACSSTRLDHGVLAVGYGTSNGQAYWLVKNSWGMTWGDQGYIMMSRNRSNNCGIATMSSYPVA
jgi:cathepsin L